MVHASDVFRNNNPQIEWDEIYRMRNYIAHAYDAFDASIAWETIVDDIPE